MVTHKKFDLIGYGAVSVDDLLYVPNYPIAGSKIEVHHRERFGGGLTGTALVAAARLQTKTAYFGTLGDDELSAFTRNEFLDDQIDISQIINKENARPIHSTIIIDQQNGERTIFYSLENFNLISSDEIPNTLCHQANYLFIDSYVLNNFPTLISMAEESNTVIIADIETERVTQFPNEFAAIHYLILNRDLASMITGKKEPSDILNHLETPNRYCSVITQGDQGCWFKTHYEPAYYLPAFPVKVVDTTGCGDVFHGAFSAALIHGKDHHQAVIWASAAAAIKATQHGGRKGIPDLPTLSRFIEEHPVNSIKVAK